MSENEEKLVRIDPEKFAYHFIDSIKELDPGLDLEGAAKKRLAAYLSAYFLIDNFNKLEEKNFMSANKNERDDLSHMHYSELLSKIMELNKY